MRYKFIGRIIMKSSTFEWTFFAPYWFYTFSLFFIYLFEVHMMNNHFLFCHLFWFLFDDNLLLMHFISYIEENKRTKSSCFLLVLDDFLVTVEKEKNLMLMFIVNIYLVYMFLIIWQHLKKKILIFMQNNFHVLLKLVYNHLR